MPNPSFIQILLPILVFLAVAALGSAIVAMTAGRRKSFQPRLRSFESGGSAAIGTSDQGLARVASRIGGAVSMGKPSVTLKEQLAYAGYYGENAATTYLGVKLLLLFIGMAGMTAMMLALPTLSLALRIYVSAMVAAVMFFLPNIVLASRRAKRRAEVRRHLPDAVDLLEICVSAGMGLDMAWNQVGDEIRNVSPVLADEMALTVLEIQLGAPRTTAMRHMAERTGAEELASLVALLVQSDRFGTSVADSLRTFAVGMRETRSQRAEEQAEKTAVKLLFPLVFFIFPVMLLVMVGPAGIVLYRIMSK